MPVNRLPTYPEGRDIRITDYHIIASLLKKHPPDISDCNFTNLFAWRFAYGYKLSILNGCIILHGFHEGKPFFLPPIGDPDKTHLASQRVFELSPDDGPAPYLACAPKPLAVSLSKIPNIKVEADRDNWDYIYKSSDLARLPGNRYHSKKNLIRQFHKRYDSRVEGLNTATCAEAMEFSDRWCEQRDCESDKGLAKEKCAIYQMLTHFEAMRLSGIVVRIDGEIVGLAIGEELNPDTYVIHVEKGDQHCRGIYQFINQEMAKIVTPRYKWINREQDLGIAGLRRAKRSYYPDHFIEKFRISYLSR